MFILSNPGSFLAARVLNDGEKNFILILLWPDFKAVNRSIRRFIAGFKNAYLRTGADFPLIKIAVFLLQFSKSGVV